MRNDLPSRQTLSPGYSMIETIVEVQGDISRLGNDAGRKGKKTAHGNTQTVVPTGEQVILTAFRKRCF
jgi:hypothetical protein